MSPGFDIATGEGQVEIYPEGRDPLTDAVERLGSTVELLQRIAASLENRAPDRRTVVALLPSDGHGSNLTMPGHSRIRVEFLIISPLGTGEPVLKIGEAIVYQTSIQAVPVPNVIPFPIVIQEGVDIELYDASAIGSIPDFVGYLIGTTE